MRGRRRGGKVDRGVARAHLDPTPQTGIEVAPEPLLVGRGYPQGRGGQELTEAVVHRRLERGQDQFGPVVGPVGGTVPPGDAVGRRPDQQ